ncbi:nitroreductase family deazaflavin-dependent oxidoreductase [Saccharopolyspora phatthalungensis]|uniref:Deazaflavin-dependent oxidoreductase (Nitroreductase family) n=1 Tax=Saccharopolyspora phatthalungensis TaxID=664693 RepID=A0A840Q226_9PSEU|nr:nitroreductase family deazaflavin-dependent oxidoreductase [Saccharopolyspora phatthalungensis]MBB5154566.1 deazaflavin-dependent oxidoreductase (nitroreductase family) [Saccharopolyspora phatthalungensis]
MVRRMPRWLARAPIPLYRHGLGWLLGSRIMMLEHRGRLSGKRRYAVLEVLDREPGALILVSGYGPSSQWFRNVGETPEVRVWHGHVRATPARATVLPAAEARAILARYREAHPRTATSLGKILGVADLIDPAPLPPDIADRLPLVRIRRSD